MAQCTQKIYFLLKANNEKLSKRSGAENVQRINEKFLRFKQSDLTKNIQWWEHVVAQHWCPQVIHMSTRMSPVLKDKANGRNSMKQLLVNVSSALSLMCNIFYVSTEVPLFLLF